MTPGLDHCENVVIVPHIASASLWTRSGMVTHYGPCIPLFSTNSTVTLTSVRRAAPAATSAHPACLRSHSLWKPHVIKGGTKVCGCASDPGLRESDQASSCLAQCERQLGYYPVTCLMQATLAAANVAARLRNKPCYNKPDILPYVEGPLEEMPDASPNIVNAEQLGLSIMS